TAPPTSPPTDPPAAALQAPTGVTGTVVADGVVEVRWAHAGPAATAFDVSVVDNGALFASVDGSERTARLTVPLGQPVRFVVTAVGDGARQASAPSAPVTASSRPGAPAAVGGSVATGAHDAGAVTATVTWGEAEAYGSPVTGYTVVLSSGGAGGATQTQRVGADARTATFTVPCTDTGGEQCDPGTTSVSVHATNAEGDGPAATATIGEGGAGAARLPGAGRQHVTGHTGGDITYEGFGEVTLSLAPPADWAAFTGTCSYTTDAGSFTLPCGETSLTIQYNEEIAYVECGRPGGVGGGQQPLTRQRQVVFTADNGRTSAQSATYTFTTEQATWCRGTPLP
ncbi:fibronectin type III domain-containing protein, partial [Nocardioides sp. ChNu-99]